MVETAPQHTASSRWLTGAAALVGPLVVLIASCDFVLSLFLCALIVLADAIVGIVRRRYGGRRIVVLASCSAFLVTMTFAGCITIWYRDLDEQEKEAWRESHHFPEKPNGTEVAAWTGFPVRGIQSTDDAYVLKEWCSRQSQPRTVEDSWSVADSVPWSRGFGALFLNYCIFYAVTLLAFAWLTKRGRQHDVCWLAVCLMMIGLWSGAHWVLRHGS